jgi:pyruvate,orthophosphate dikinase
MPQWVYDFADGSRDMRELLGGKGANVAEMTRVLGGDRVPAGFTITTQACVEYMRADRQEPETRCWCQSGRERASRCRGCSTRC